MSVFITPIAPISVDTAVEPPAGSVIEASSGESIVVTDPTDPNQPIGIIAPDVGSIKIASGIEGADIVVEGGGANIEIGNSTDSNGNPLDASGTTYQIEDDYEGRVVVNLEGAITGNKVDTSTETFSGNTIADAAPSNAADELDFYVNTGSADDVVGGSKGNDFIRLGAGDDEFNAGNGNDIVRMGSGDDFGSLGGGNDIVYFTVDQLQGDQLKLVTDFDSNGNDKIQIDADLEGLIDIDGIGSNSITITLSGDQSGTTEFVSEGENIDEDDIEFV